MKIAFCCTCQLTCLEIFTIIAASWDSKWTKLKTKFFCVSSNSESIFLLIWILIKFCLQFSKLYPSQIKWAKQQKKQKNCFWSYFLKGDIAADMNRKVWKKYDRIIFFFHRHGLFCFSYLILKNEWAYYFAPSSEIFSSFLKGGPNFIHAIISFLQFYSNPQNEDPLTKKTETTKTNVWE